MVLAVSDLAKQQEKKLQDEKKDLLKQIAELQKGDPFLNPDYAYDNAAVDTDVREQLSHQTIEAQIKDLQKRIQDIDMAMLKITKGRYGYCEKCNKQIPAARLALIPESRYCVDCENKLHT
ncbi:hypothetical protein HGA88_02105 [Candidatus Roizmanbacteria bacterium]|nr:hypothetical protein [Candidatus Roizmanbacteria bacterium]